MQLAQQKVEGALVVADAQLDAGGAPLSTFDVLDRVINELATPGRGDVAVVAQVGAGALGEFGGLGEAKFETAGG